jgi:hypothetical protein
MNWRPSELLSDVGSMCAVAQFEFYLRKIKQCLQRAEMAQNPVARFEWLESAEKWRLMIPDEKRPPPGSPQAFDWDRTQAP